MTFEEKVVALTGPMNRSRKLADKYERLRNRFNRAGGDINASSKARKIAQQMQALEGEFYDVWYPHKNLLGVCPECCGIRLPADKGGKRGLGCLDCKGWRSLTIKDTQVRRAKI